MKTIILVTLFVSMTLATSPPAHPPPIRPHEEPAAIVKSSSEFLPDGSYSFSYESSDGSAREETGVLKNAGTDDAYVAQSGWYRYNDDEGKKVEVHYTADENGFVPEGDVIAQSIIAAARAAGTLPALVPAPFKGAKKQ